jgi:anti-sigma B factor antagonist
MHDPSDELELRSSRTKSGHIVRVGGEVNLRSSPQLRGLLMRVIAQDPGRLIVDLSKVSYMDSSGVGTLVEIKRLVEREGGRLVLAALQPRVRGVLEISQLDKFFTIVQTIDEDGQG